MAIADNLVAYWKLENANDSVGTNNLTNTGSVAFSATGKIGNCATFGLNKRLQAETNFSIGSSTPFSVSMWVKFDTDIGTTTDISNVVQFFGLQKGSGQGYENLYYDGRSGTRRISSENGTAITYNVTLGTTWHHIMWTKATGTTGVQKLYIDGTKVGSDGAAQAAGGAWTVFAIGNDPNSTTFSKAYLIDEVGVWSRELTSTEVSSLYNSGNGWQYPFATTQTLTMTAAVSATVLTGNAATLVYTRAPLVTVVAGFTLTGNAADFLFAGNDRLIAQVGAFVVTTPAATFHRGINMPSTFGTFIISGQNAAYGRGMNLPTSVTAYTLTGQSANFRAGGWMVEAIHTSNWVPETKS